MVVLLLGGTTCDAGRQATTLDRRPGVDLRVSVEPVTAMRYVNAVRALDVWMASWGFPASSVQVGDVHAFGLCLVAYVQMLYDSGAPQSWATTTLAGLQFVFPELRTNLKRPWTALRRWQFLEPPRVRNPIPEQILWAMVALAWCWGWHATGVLLWLAFEAMLRPGEVASLLRQHLRLPDLRERLEQMPGVVSLTKAKTAARGARLQSAVVRSGKLLDALVLLFGELPSRTLLAAGGVRGFTSRFDALARALQVRDHFSAGGLRGGGAIAFFARTPNLGELQFAGRWEAPSSLRHYLQHGLSVEAWLDLSPETKRRVRFWASLKDAIHVDIATGLLEKQA